MTLKISLRTILPGCYKPKCASSEPKNQVSEQICPQRISLSDISNPTSSVLSVSDLLNLFIGTYLHIFTVMELKAITNNFSSSNYLGQGGFGPVHKGFIDEKVRPGLEAQPVAVKLLDLDGAQGHKEWLAEVILLGQLRHPNLVKLIGYCCEHEYRLLVYEYMARGNLENQLFSKYSMSLPWHTRIKIAVGAAKGLAFLHEEGKPVIYRDFKTSNILLDSDYNAKLADFGLAMDGPQGDETHVTTRVMGTQGYVAPEYIMTGHLTTMSDLYSYGVVLLELLTGRRAVDKSRPSREKSLVEWARPFVKDPNKLDRIMDPRLEGQYSVEGSKKVALLAYHCLNHRPKCRPQMTDVVKTLEPLVDLEDIPVMSFVYVVPSERETKTDGLDRESENEEKAAAKVETGCEQQQNGHRHRHMHKLRLLKSSAVHSETGLYRRIANGLKSPKH